jgi:hypothetical protein
VTVLESVHLHAHFIPFAAMTAGEQAAHLVAVHGISADRGREDFEYLVSRGGEDYTKSDIRRQRAWHRREKAVEKKILRQIRST